MQNDLLKNLTMEMLLQSPAGEKLAKAMSILSDLQEKLGVLADKEDGIDSIRVGTVLVLAILSKLSSGKNASDLNREDWSQIAETVFQYGIAIDGQKYSEFVFLMYARYIEASAQSLQDSVSEENLQGLQDLAEELREQTRTLEDGAISEPDYVEACLWLVLEGMIKLLCAMAETVIGPDFGKLTQASALLAFEYARYKLYQKEKELLTEYIGNQYRLDEELQEKFDSYLAELQAESGSFNQLITNAFAPEFRYSLRESAMLARAVGVKEEDILDSMEKIDDFFLGAELEI